MNPERAIHYAGESSRTTHGAPAAVDACKFYTALILGALKGWSKEELLSPDFYQGSLVPEIAEIAAGSFKPDPCHLARIKREKFGLSFNETDTISGVT